MALARSVGKIVVAKGRKVVGIDLEADKPDDDTLASLLLGPTGNLRAPALLEGRTLYVGFNAEAYAALAP